MLYIICEVYTIFINIIVIYCILFISSDDLWELVQLSGVPINREVSKIVSGCYGNYVVLANISIFIEYCNVCLH